jgi:hypothetical protein
MFKSDSNQRDSLVLVRDYTLELQKVMHPGQWDIIEVSDIKTVWVDQDPSYPDKIGYVTIRTKTMGEFKVGWNIPLEEAQKMKNAIDEEIKAWKERKRST